MKSEEIDIFEAHDVKYVCDAACGFGAYTLAFTSNGFHVKSFDISPTAVKVANNLLAEYIPGAYTIKIASVLSTEYEDNEFDAVVAYSVLDHLCKIDADAALVELLRITKPGDLLLFSFDTPEVHDYEYEHSLLPDGSMIYHGNNERDGMIFRPFSWEMIHNFVAPYEIIHEITNIKGQRIIIIKK